MLQEIFLYFSIFSDSINFFEGLLFFSSCKNILCALWLISKCLNSYMVKSNDHFLVIHDITYYFNFLLMILFYFYKLWILLKCKNDSGYFWILFFCFMGSVDLKTFFKNALQHIFTAYQTSCNSRYCIF